METPKPYEEVINFIAAGTTPESVIAFHPSPAAQERVDELIERSKTTGLTADEQVELDHYVELEHLMRMAKARAHQLLKS